METSLSQQTVWRHAYSATTRARPSAIWNLWTDVQRWGDWNAGVEAIELHGPFQEGTEFTMKPPGQEPIRSRIVRVVPEVEFVDKTVVGNLTVFVAHRLERINDAELKIVYEVEAVGPAANEIGPLVSADFPEVLEALTRLAESRR